MMRRRIWALALASSIGGTLWAQSDSSSAAEDDFSQYDNLGFVDAGAKRFCSPKIEGLSPAKLISLGYDYQGAYNLSAGTLFNASGAELAAAEDALGDAFLSALKTWEESGVPKNPEAWLLVTARNRLIDAGR